MLIGDYPFVTVPNYGIVDLKTPNPLILHFKTAVKVNLIVYFWIFYYQLFICLFFDISFVFSINHSKRRDVENKGYFQHF